MTDSEKIELLRQYQVTTSFWKGTVVGNRKIGIEYGSACKNLSNYFFASGDLFASTNIMKNLPYYRIGFATIVIGLVAAKIESEYSEGRWNSMEAGGTALVLSTAGFAIWKWGESKYFLPSIDHFNSYLKNDLYSGSATP